jgi:hypothetical protein
LTPAHLLTAAGLLLVCSLLPAFVCGNLNPFRRGFTYYYEEPITGKALAEPRSLWVGWSGARRERVFRVANDYLQGPREFRVKHPGNVTCSAVLDLGNSMILYLKPLSEEPVSPEFRATLEESLLGTLRSNQLAAPETRVYWSGNSPDPI